MSCSREQFGDSQKEIVVGYAETRSLAHGFRNPALPDTTPWVQYQGMTKWKRAPCTHPLSGRVSRDPLRHTTRRVHPAGFITINTHSHSHTQPILSPALLCPSLRACSIPICVAWRCLLCTENSSSDQPAGHIPPAWKHGRPAGRLSCVSSPTHAPDYPSIHLIIIIHSPKKRKRKCRG